MKKKVLGQYTLRPDTIKALREHAAKTGHSMSLIVDLAIEDYIKYNLSNQTRKDSKK